jgi:hypothetical protein
MRPTYPDHTEAHRGDQSLKDQIRSVESETLTAAQPHSEENHRAKSWRAIPYRVVLLSFVFLAALAWTRHNLNGGRFRSGSRFLHLRIRREKEAISITRRVYICKWGDSQPRAMIGQVYSQPPAGSKNGTGKEVVIQQRICFFFALWLQPKQSKVDQGWQR